MFVITCCRLGFRVECSSRWGGWLSLVRFADLGGGIGRVVGGVLAPLFDKVDLVEPNKRFLDTARREIDAEKLDQTIQGSIQVGLYHSVTVSVVPLGTLSSGTAACYTDGQWRAVLYLMPNPVCMARSPSVSVSGAPVNAYTCARGCTCRATRLHRTSTLYRARTTSFGCNGWWAT